MRVLAFALSLFVVTVAPTLSSAQAASEEELKGFWQKGDVTNWSTDVKANSSTGILYRDYPMGIDQANTLTKQENQKIAQGPQPQQAPQNPQNTAQNQQISQNPQQPQQQEQPMTREQILAKFGSPDQTSPIRAQKDAPPEMQGLFAALNSGDKELAWQYSIALARRTTEIQSMVSKATDYQLLAMESLGMREKQEIDPTKDTVNPVRLEVKELMDRTRSQELQRKIEIEKALAEQGIQLEATQAQGAAALAPKVPVDPEGKVKVLVFFDEQDPSVKPLGKALEPLKESLKADPNVSFLGLTKRSYAVPALKNIAATSSFPFPLLNGEALAQELRIQSYPTILFLAVTTKQTYRLEGIKTAEEVGQVIKAMKGQR
jgi:hypothetical protein